MKQKAVLLISGKVQGVGYRFFVSDTARSLGLTGWVRNNPDGTVESEADGEKDAVENFIEQIRENHPWARIDGIKIVWADFDGKNKNFNIKY